MLLWKIKNEWLDLFHRAVHYWIYQKTQRFCGFQKINKMLYKLLSKGSWQSSVLPFVQSIHCSEYSPEHRATLQVNKCSLNLHLSQLNAPTPEVHWQAGFSVWGPNPALEPVHWSRVMTYITLVFLVAKETRTYKENMKARSKTSNSMQNPTPQIWFLSRKSSPERRRWWRALVTQLIYAVIHHRQ